MSATDNEHFSFPIVAPLISFSCLIGLATILAGAVLSRSGSGG